MQLPNILGFTFGVVQMGLYVFYMNATPVAGEGKEGKGKLAAAEELPVVVNVGKLAAATPDRSTGAVHVHPVPRSCAAEAAVAEPEVLVDIPPPPPPRAVEVAAV